MRRTACRPAVDETLEKAVIVIVERNRVDRGTGKVAQSEALVTFNTEDCRTRSGGELERFDYFAVAGAAMAVPSSIPMRPKPGSFTAG